MFVLYIVYKFGLKDVVILLLLLYIDKYLRDILFNSFVNDMFFLIFFRFS